MDELLQTIHSSNLFSGITNDEILAMLRCLDARMHVFNEGNFILREGDDVDAIGLVLEGSALIIQEDKWGNRNIVSKIGPSQSFATAFACAPGTVLNVSVLAETQVQVMFLDVRRVLTICSSACAHHNKIIRNIISELAENNLRINDKLTHMGKRSTREKLMSYLSAVSQKCSSREFDIPFTRQQLADYLGVERSGLSLELGKMRKAGLIDFRKNHFVIKV